MKTRKRPWARALTEIIWFSWLPVAAFVLIWIFSGMSTSFYLPSAQVVLEQTWQVWFVEGGIAENLVPSLIRLVAGFALAVALGVGFGVLLGLVRPLESAVRPLTDAARTIPGAALLPIAIMFFGLGDAMKIAMIAFISMWPILLNTIEGVRSIDPTLRSVMATFRNTRRDRLQHVFLPQAMPQVFAGARIGLAISIAVMVVVEMFGTPGGIGYFIRHAQQTFRVVDMWTGLVILGIFGYLLNILFRILERRVLHWYHAMIAQAQGASA